MPHCHSQISSRHAAVGLSSLVCASASPSSTMNFFFGTTTPETPEEPHFASADDVDFAAFGKQSVQILLDRHTGADKVSRWELVDNQPDVRVWRGEVDGNSWSPFRVTLRIRTDKAKVQAALLDISLITKLDDMTESARVLKTIEGHDGHLTLRHIVSKGVLLVAPRDFVVVTTSTSVGEDKIIIASRSIPLASAKPAEGVVRGKTLISGYIIHEHRTVDGRVFCEVTLVAHADLSGYIPASVINMLGTSATVKILSNLRTMLEKK